MVHEILPECSFCCRNKISFMFVDVAGISQPEVIAQVHEKFRNAMLYEVSKLNTESALFCQHHHQQIGLMWRDIFYLPTSPKVICICP